MNHPTISLLVKRYAKNEDQGWEWIRDLHDLGYQLEASNDFDVRFSGNAGYIVPVIKLGDLGWIRAVNLHSRVGAYHAVDHGVPVFPDPTSAARWWEVEKGNQPAVYPGPAPAPMPPMPFYQPPKSPQPQPAQPVPWGSTHDHTT